MKIIPLSNLPNQSFSFTVDGAYWEVHIYQAIDHMCTDITRNGESLVFGMRCLEGALLLPFSYLWNPGFGNMVFTTEPDWEKFGTTCLLYYLNNDEARQWENLTQFHGIVQDVNSNAGSQ